MDKRIDDLLDDYLSGSCTEAERQMLESHYLRHLDAHTPVPSEQQVNDSFVQTHRQIWEEIQQSDSPGYGLVKKR
ncbi:Putative zinc-finger [Sphingobacterium nematocida]|uniref:Putative zinc-finger n=1 Tax=Sphingobacterium nematocida TaxID=1513896 RepID=A0A1T5EF35_9SPHI|nr:zf-HC2 domain-containing protein [Sphingobacterium nematocida]SKB82534.1 Putative zinc-finger [Sphingobacterium nematocida]